MLKYLLLISTCFPLVFLYSQMSAKYTNEYVIYDRAIELFEKEQFSAARNEFRAYLNLSGQKNDPTYIKASYYEAISGLELQHNDAVSMVEKFIQNYPENIYNNSIYNKLGLYYYAKKDWKEVIKWFKKIKTIQQDQKDEYYFKLGYAYFQLKKITDARKMFFEVRKSTSQYGAPALYYYSHIAYQEKQYQTALEGFTKLLSDKKFSTMVPYYICQIYYYQQKYDEVAEFAKTLTDSTSKANQRQVQQIIGDSYYKIGKFKEAVTFLEKSSKNQKLTREEEFQLAYSFYKSANYDKAIKLFDRIKSPVDKEGHTALYHIGECYLKKGDELAARKAFEIASIYDVLPQIQEDALYNFAVLSYKLDINPYNEALRALSLYIQKYPNSPRKNDAVECLINVYMQTNNYESALKSLDKFAKLDIKLGTAYQIISFNRGVELFLKGNYYKAVDAFELVDKHPVNLEFSAKAKYWVAESYLLSNNYSKAITAYKNFLDFHNVYLPELRADAYYNLGYAHLNKSAYPSVIESFKMYLQEAKLIGSKEKKLDATMRLADTYFLTKANDLAIRYYQEAIKLNEGSQDQALFFIAKTYGYKQDFENKALSLESILINYPASKYKLNTLFELGLTYRLLKSDDKAFQKFDKICLDYPESSLVKDALIEMADIYMKKEEFTLSEINYKKVLEKYSADRLACANAVKGLVNLYKTLLQPERVEEVINQYDCAEFSKDEQEEIYYNTALDPYLDSAFAKALPMFEKYLTKFPKGKYHIELKSYLANTLIQLKQEDSAVKIYRQILDEPTTDFSELAAIRVSRYFYNSKKYEEALIYYTKLENITTKPDVIKNTTLGLMRCHFILEHWSNAASYAAKVLAASPLTSSVQLEAEFAHGISSYHTSKYPESKRSLAWVILNTTKEFAAEARFSIADIAFLEKDLTKANEEIQGLMKMKPSYDFWIAKAILLQSKIHVEKFDLIQAEQSINTVLENYPNQDDGIIKEAVHAKEELLKLKNPPLVEKVIEVLPEEIEIDENQENEIEDTLIEIESNNEQEEIEGQQQEEIKE